MVRRVLAAATAVALVGILAAFSPRGPEWTAHPPIHPRPGASATYQSGYTPSQIQTAYGLGSLTDTGAGQTIAIVDAYGSPTIQKDLATFDSQFGLPAANLVVHAMAPRLNTNSGWALETSLDVEWAHALAPSATILLVEAKSSSLSDLLNAVGYANSQGATVVSMSWGGSEFSGESAYDGYFTHAGTLYVASSGDGGHGVEWPAASPHVVAVGGTTLTTQANGGYLGETAWSGSGGGISAYEPMPGYQASFLTSAARGDLSLAGSRRGVPDVAWDADPNTGVAVYDSTPYNGQAGWWVVGGTSVGAPSWSAVFALAPGSGGDPALYSLAASAYSTDYHDIVSGGDGTCGTVCDAGTGYDFVTGLGSPQANDLVMALGGR
jgi:subtilase family serine protease